MIGTQGPGNLQIQYGKFSAAYLPGKIGQACPAKQDCRLVSGSSSAAGCTGPSRAALRVTVLKVANTQCKRCRSYLPEL
jgi:hypothetical protein